MQRVVPPQYVRLDVGGKRYTTLLATLTKQPDCMLATVRAMYMQRRCVHGSDGLPALTQQMFGGLAGVSDEASPLCTLAQDADGVYIVDRDGPSFRYILNYLRNESEQQIPLPRDREGRQLLALEAEYYMLDELAAMCRGASIDHRVRQPADTAFQRYACYSHTPACNALPVRVLQGCSVVCV
jgi:hypothetical protein